MNTSLYRRRSMSPRGSEELVWVSSAVLCRNSISLGNNAYQVRYNSIPIYALGARAVESGSRYSCRGGLNWKAGKQTYSNDISTTDGTRVWLSGEIYNGNQGNMLTFKVVEGNGNQITESGWITYDEAGFDRGQTITFYDGSTLDSVYLYWNNDPSRISRYDLMGAGPLYFFCYQTNFPATNFYFLIPRTDLNDILGI